MRPYAPRTIPRYPVNGQDWPVTPEKLLVAAADAWRKPYAPYSRYRVSAAIATADGKIYRGCNVECADYDGTHAEEAALAAMVMDGQRDPVALVVIGALDSDTPQFSMASPCGKCRQKLVEFAEFSGRDLMVLTRRSDLAGFEFFYISDALPEAFGPRMIGVDVNRWR